MNFCLDARTVQEHFPGVGRYTAGLARAMVSLLEKDERLVLLRDPSRPSPWKLAALANEHVQLEDVPVSPFSLRQQLVVPQRLRRLGIGLYHSPYYLMPFRPGVPTVVTIYDLIPLRYPKFFTPTQRLLFAVAIRLAARAARTVIAISEATARDLERFLRLPAERIVVIPGAADPTFRPQPAAAVAALRTRLNLPDQHALYVGSNKPHKNLVRLVEAWPRLRPAGLPLVIAGAWDPRFPEARHRAEALGLGQTISFIGPVVEADLAALYSSAALFVFPSEYEGFGLPLIEAMACGVPVVCSNTPGLTEVAGEAAALFDPLSVDAIATVIHAVLRDPERRAELARRSLERAAQFSWEQTARRTLSVYRQALT